MRVLLAVGLLAEQVAALKAGGGISAEWLAHEAFVLAKLRISADDVVAMLGDGGQA